MAFSVICRSSARSLRGAPIALLAQPSSSALRQRAVQAPRLAAATSIRCDWVFPVLRRPNSSVARQPDVEERRDEKAKTYSNKVAGEPRIFRYAIYTVAVSLATYATAAYVSVKDTSETAYKFNKSSNAFGGLVNFLAGALDGSSTGGPAGRISEEQLWDVKQYERAAELGQWLVRLRKVCAGLSEEMQEKIYEAYTTVAERYLDLPFTQSALVPIVAFNVSVYLLLRCSAFSRSGRFYHFLMDNLAHRPSANKVSTSTTSAFTHLGVIHLGLNMYALWSVGSYAFRAPSFLVDEEGRRSHSAEASLLPHLFAFFLVAGTFSGFCSQVYNRLLFTVVRQRAGQMAAVRRVGFMPHVGASGALYAFFTMFALSFRNQSEMSVVFFPQYRQESFRFLQIMVVAETCLMIAALVLARRISPLGHDAHMGGALFGYLYYKYGNAWWEECKRRAQRFHYGVMEGNSRDRASFPKKSSNKDLVKPLCEEPESKKAVRLV